MSASYTAKEGGYAYLYASNEHPTQVDVYFDDIFMSYTPSRILQSNEYYPFGAQTARSWTRESAAPNNFLGNGGTEYNATSSQYDLDFRNYDPILGRLNQVDPLSNKYGGLSPYHFSFNNPVTWNDPSGASADNPSSWAGGPYEAGTPWSHNWFTGRPANQEGVNWDPNFQGPKSYWDNETGILYTYLPSKGMPTKLIELNRMIRAAENSPDGEIKRDENGNWGYYQSYWGVDKSQIGTLYNQDGSVARVDAGAPVVGMRFVQTNIKALQASAVPDDPMTLTLISLSTDLGIFISDIQLILNSLPLKESKALLGLKRLNPIGGILDVMSHTKEAYHAFRSNDIVGGLTSTSKVGVDLFFLATKTNPWYVGGQALWSLYNVYEDANSYGLLKNKN